MPERPLRATRFVEFETREAIAAITSLPQNRRGSHLPSLGRRGEGWVVGQLVLMAGVFVSAAFGRGWSGGCAVVAYAVGGTLLGLGLGLLVTAALQLGSSLTPFPAPRTDQGLVTTGAFALSRHPMYGGGILIALGWTIIFASPASLAWTVVAGALPRREDATRRALAERARARLRRLPRTDAAQAPALRLLGGEAMKVLTVYAHPNPGSFCHAVLDRFTQGLADAGHESEVVDLYAIKFNPVFTGCDFSFFAHEPVPPDVLSDAELRDGMVAGSGGPIRRRVAARWLRDKDRAELLRIVAKQRPKDVLEQQAKVARADGLAVIAPIFWMNFPAILRGWVERVFTYGVVYTMTADAWRMGNLNGRVPLLQHKKALIMTSTFFTERDYRESGLGDAIKLLVDDFGFRYPGIETVEHEYFYAVGAVGAATRDSYLQRAHRLGHEFEAGIARTGDRVEDAAPSTPR